MVDFTGGTWRSLIDGSEVGGIPDAAIHQWRFDEGAGETVSDSVGSEDGTISGADWTSNDWEGGWALDGDGTGDYVSTGELGDFGENLHTDFALIATVETNDDSGTIMGVFHDPGDASTNAMEFGFDIEFDGDAGKIALRLRDDDGDPYTIQTDSRFDDGGRYRVVANKVANSGSDGIEIWINGEKVETTVESDGGFDDPTSNFTVDMGILARNNDGTFDRHLDGIIDNVIITDDSLSESEIKGDYNNQPWS